jgi:hypothetical protein
MMDEVNGACDMRVQSKEILVLIRFWSQNIKKGNHLGNLCVETIKIDLTEVWCKRVD